MTLGDGAAFGAGGPNQEAALARGAAARAARRSPRSSSTPTAPTAAPTHAGAVVDGHTSRARRASSGIDLRDALLAHRSGAALARARRRVVTGPTGTNVNDLFAIAIGEVAD